MADRPFSEDGMKTLRNTAVFVLKRPSSPLLAALRSRTDQDRWHPPPPPLSPCGVPPRAQSRTSLPRFDSLKNHRVPHRSCSASFRLWPSRVGSCSESWRGWPCVTKRATRRQGVLPRCGCCLLGGGGGGRMMGHMYGIGRCCVWFGVFALVFFQRKGVAFVFSGFCAEILCMCCV